MDHILQLGLNRLRKSNRKDSIVQIVWLIDQLLEVIAEYFVDEDDGDSSFRSQLDCFRRENLQTSKFDVSESAAIEALDMCRAQFKKTQILRRERDDQFGAIIQFLRKALISLTGDSSTFHEDLLETAGRIRELVYLKDVQELRIRIIAEVNELHSVIAEKQKREQLQYAQLSEQVSVLQHKLEAANVEASLDGLTGIANRRNCDYTIQRWVLAHEKSEESFTVAILDLDDFKKINDCFGHQIGDQVLIETAMELGRNIRANDFLARYGGDEFLIISNGMKLQESENRFSELLKHIEGMKFDCSSQGSQFPIVSLAASCGVAEYALGESPKDLIQRADEAMYEAKRSGKNRVVVKRRSLIGALYEGRKRSSIA